mgnify:CR=1 FL=1
MVQGSKVYILQPCNNEISKLFSILVVSIIKKFHKKEIVQEELWLSVDHDLINSWLCAVKHVFDSSSFFNWSWLGWKHQSHEEVWKVEA